MNPLIQYREPQFRFYLWDKSLGKEACPFPTKTDTFEVVDFGTGQGYPDDDPPLHGRDQKNGERETWVHVIWTRPCGHTVLDRVNFWEGVETFSHYGTVFKGEEYSIKDWKRRMEYFRTSGVCDCCKISRHLWWIRRIGMTRSCGLTEKSLPEYVEQMLDHSYLNWREFVDPVADLANRRFWRTPELTPK